jgi:hypothetical protein
MRIAKNVCCTKAIVNIAKWIVNTNIAVARSKYARQRQKNVNCDGGAVGGNA